MAPGTKNLFCHFVSVPWLGVSCEPPAAGENEETMSELKERIEKVLLNRASQGTYWASITADEIMQAIEQPEKPSHSPLPWKACNDGCSVEDAKGATVCTCMKPSGPDKVDRDFILKAVNGHEKLVGFAKRISELVTEDTTRLTLGQGLIEDIRSDAIQALRAAGEEA